MGAVILPLMGIYLILLIVGTAYGWRWAKRRGYSTVKRALCAFGGFLIIYLPLMWDWIPTIVTYNHYCKTQSGSWVYKTPQQWEKENPGVMETLKYNENGNIKLASDRNDKFNEVSSYKKNDRFYSVHKIEKVSNWLPIFRTTDIIYDVNDNFVMVKKVNFYSGYASGLAGIYPEGEGWTAMKFWLARRYCPFGTNPFNTREAFKNGRLVYDYLSNGGKND